MHNYKVLDNGKLLISIIDCKINKYGLCSENQVVHHIEIYDPVANKFYAERKKDVMKNNLFTINKPNGDVLFINENSSYIFKKDTNKFEKADEEETRKNLEAVKRIKEKFRDLGLKFGVNQKQYLSLTKVIKIAPEKFLLGCEYKQYVDKGFKLPTACKKTVYYDYGKNIVKYGPDFILDHLSEQEAISVSENLLILISGENGSAWVKNFYFPSRYSQLIHVKD